MKMAAPWSRRRADRGYGTSVIRELVPYELGGTVEIEYRDKGVRCTIEFAIQSDGDHAAPLCSEHHAKND